jgi:hypothetical protein
MTINDENDSGAQMKQGYAIKKLFMVRGDRGGSVVKVLLQIRRSLVRSHMVSLEFFIGM